MAAERKELGPIAYPLLKTVYGIAGLGMGAAIAIGAGLGAVAVLIPPVEGLFSLVGGTISPDQNFYNIFSHFEIPVGGVGLFFGGPIGADILVTEFNRNFTKRPRRTRR